MDLLEEGCQQLQIPLDAAQLDQFRCYFEELVAWNQKFNLTAITEDAEVQVKHFLDSLVGLPVIAAELHDTIPPARTLRAVDVGTGAGFPGLPLKLAWPDLRLTLMDGTGKKVSFLRKLVEKLQLANVAVVQGRAEELGREELYREQFDLVVARAVAPLKTLVEYLVPLTRQGGFVMAYKGPSASQEFAEARKAIGILGGETVRFAPVTVPFLNEERRILLIQKLHSTPTGYPRGQGLPRKKPLA